MDERDGNGPAGSRHRRLRQLSERVDGILTMGGMGLRVPRTKVEHSANCLDVQCHAGRIVPRYVARELVVAWLSKGETKGGRLTGLDIFDLDFLSVSLQRFVLRARSARRQVHEFGPPRSLR